VYARAHAGMWTTRVIVHRPVLRDPPQMGLGDRDKEVKAFSVKGSRLVGRTITCRHPCANSAPSLGGPAPCFEAMGGYGSGEYHPDLELPDHLPETARI
jgi:hypothetical protein